MEKKTTISLPISPNTNIHDVYTQSYGIPDSLSLGDAVVNPKIDVVDNKLFLVNNEIYDILKKTTKSRDIFTTFVRHVIQQLRTYSDNISDEDYFYKVPISIFKDLNNLLNADDESVYKTFLTFEHKKVYEPTYYIHELLEKCKLDENELDTFCTNNINLIDAIKRRFKNHENDLDKIKLAISNLKKKISDDKNKGGELESWDNEIEEIEKPVEMTGLLYCDVIGIKNTIIEIITVGFDTITAILRLPKGLNIYITDLIFEPNKSNNVDLEKLRTRFCEYITIECLIRKLRGRTSQKFHLDHKIKLKSLYEDHCFKQIKIIKVDDKRIITYDDKVFNLMKKKLVDVNIKK